MGSLCSWEASQDGNDKGSLHTFSLGLSAGPSQPLCCSTISLGLLSPGTPQERRVPSPVTGHLHNPAQKLLSADKWLQEIDTSWVRAMASPKYLSVWY